MHENIDHLNETIIIGKEGGNKSAPFFRNKVSLPKSWLDQMGIDESQLEVSMDFYGDRIIITHPNYPGFVKVPLASKEKLIPFAYLWLGVFKNHDKFPGIVFEDISCFGAACASMGFDMDCGKSLNETLPDKNCNDLEVFKDAIKEIDIQVLGNAMHSMWRYHNHWSMAPMTDEDYEWFAIALQGLLDKLLISNP